MDEFQRGIIRAVRAEGGLLGLTLENPKTGQRSYVVGDNGPTVRALAEVFGDDIIEGHALIVDRLIGQEIGYRLNEFGVLEYLES